MTVERVQSRVRPGVLGWLGCDDGLGLRSQGFGVSSPEDVHGQSGDTCRFVNSVEQGQTPVED